jgi:hypothetical protein
MEKRGSVIIHKYPVDYSTVCPSIYISRRF